MKNYIKKPLISVMKKHVIILFSTSISLLSFQQNAFSMQEHPDGDVINQATGRLVGSLQSANAEIERLQLEKGNLQRSLEEADRLTHYLSTEATLPFLSWTRGVFTGKYVIGDPEASSALDRALTAQSINNLTIVNTQQAKASAQQLSDQIIAPFLSAQYTPMSTRTKITLSFSPTPNETYMMYKPLIESFMDRTSDKMVKEEESR